MSEIKTHISHFTFNFFLLYYLNIETKLTESYKHVVQYVYKFSTNMNVGAVGCLRRVKNAIGVARKVLENTHHSFLAGELATEFAVEMGFTEESLTTNSSYNRYQNWLSNSCLPNFWTVMHTNTKTVQQIQK